MKLFDDFDDNQWVSRLAESLQELSKAQAYCVDAYFESPLHDRAGNFGTGIHIIRKVGEDIQHTGTFGKDIHRSGRYAEALGRLYHAAWFNYTPASLGYEPLRPALERVLDILRQHPVLEQAVSNRKGNLEYWIQLLGSGGLRHLVYMAAGLMDRARELPDDGFSVACTELAALLLISQARDAPLLLPNHHNRAYHFVPFVGLQVTENIRIARDMTLVSFKDIQPYLDDDDLQRLAPDIAPNRAPDLIAAIRQPGRWKPLVQSQGSMENYLPPSPRCFFDDADVMLRLLSITHAAPILSLGQMGFCIQQPAARLLGYHRYNPGINWTRARPSLNNLPEPVPLDDEAFASAAQPFAQRNKKRFKDYAALVARMAESRARTGPFAHQDRILDVAITLEQMYELDSGEISFKLRARAACFLTDNAAKRKQIFREVRDVYDLRSALVHSRRPSKKSKKLLTPQNMRDTFETGFALARATLMKLLDQGPPDSWDELVISADHPR